ncbi:PAS domain S-box protein [Halorussus marinus]|uniref:PAS domain S-box protein n=1 Tax=Halorussus marinus TaxID=2505976 RepID=UPI0010931459|nr:PAS domain S-box protein [Halorussus marinus]
MTDLARVLYVAPTPERGDAVESYLAAGPSGVDVSVATTAAEALAAIDDRDIDRAVVDEHVADAAATLRAADPDLPVETLAAPPEASTDVAARALADRIARAATANGDRPMSPEPEFGAVARAASDAVLVVDADGVVRFANDAVEGVFGYEPAELIGEPLARLVPERHRGAMARSLREGDRTLDREYVEFPGRHRDGRELALGVSFSEFTRGGERRFAGVIRDVTERERRLEPYEAMVEAVDDGIYALDADSRFIAVNDAYCRLTGIDRTELLGERAASVFGESLAGSPDRLREIADGSGGPATIETTVPSADGESRPVEIRLSRCPLEGGETGRVGIVRDISARKRREAKLTSLHDLVQSLADAETDAEVYDTAVDAGVGTLGFENVAIVSYESGALVPAAREWAGGEIDDALVGRRGDGVAWEAFAASESRSVDDLRVERGDEAAMASVLAVPLGRHGAFLAGDPEPGAFDETDRSLAELLCATVTAALDRAEREETLRRRRDELEAKNRELERANRLNEVIRKLTRALIEAATRDELLRSVCERLTESGPYRFAWFGEYDRATGEVVPAATAGVEEGYLESVTVRAKSDDPESQGPSGRAIRTGEPQVQNDIFGDPPFEPWREQALKRGYRSSAAIPVVYDENRYGVLNIYAGEPDVFDETERIVLAELGDITGYALNALERKQALVSDRSIDLDFRVRGSEYPILTFVTETDGEFEFESVVQRGDGSLHLFFTVRGAEPTETLTFAEALTEIENTRLVAERDGEYRYEGELVASSFLASLVNRGAVPQSLTASDGEGRVVVRIPESANVRTFVELFESAFEEVELVARRERDEPVLSEQAFASKLEGRLTERQREVLEVAYFGGFFEWPRDATAEDIAEMLGVSQPTVSRHVRAGERALFSLYFEDAE